MPKEEKPTLKQILGVVEQHLAHDLNKLAASAARDIAKKRELIRLDRSLSEDEESDAAREAMNVGSRALRAGIFQAACACCDQFSSQDHLNAAGRANTARAHSSLQRTDALVMPYTREDAAKADYKTISVPAFRVTKAYGRGSDDY